MKYQKLLFWVALIQMIFVCVVFTGCFEQLSPQPELHPTAGTSVMFIPKGCKIGNIITDENGIYINESKLIEALKQQRAEEQRNRI